MIRLPIALAVFASGCSILYNPDNIPSKQDAFVPDADPSNLMVTDLGPNEIFEGQGDGGSRPAVLVIHGNNFVVGAQVELTSAMPVQVEVDNTNVTISKDTHYLAVPVIARVDDALADGMLVAISVKVTQPVPGGTVSQTLDGLKLHGLDTLTGTIGDCSMLKPLYAKISTTGTVALTSSVPMKPCVFRAVSSVAMGDLSAHGGNAAQSGTNGAPAGPGGCPGGNGLISGGCDTHGGRGANGGALAGGGGGGGGFATDGESGNGTGPGAGGGMTGDPMVPLFTANFASGGGGGAGLINSAGGGGGGGGGTIEVTAGGDLTIGMVDVSGGNGGKTGGVTDAGGGGGAGGAIIVRSGGAIATGKLLANGGAPGNGGGVLGGKGSDGRIRWEALSGSPTSASAPMPMQGVSFVATTPFALTASSDPLSLVGSSTTFNMYAKDKTGRELPGSLVSVTGGGMATGSPQLFDGYNQVCITLSPGTTGTHGAAEAERCLDIAYLP